MYAEHRYIPRQSRSVSLGAALAINGAILTGMLFYLAPNVISTGPADPIHVIDIIDPPEPPPVQKPEPKANLRAQTPLPTAPKPEVATKSASDFETQPTIYPPVPPMPPADPGPLVKAEPTPPPPLPPLLAAEQDPRFARDFQPAYPASELRAQRDGLVKLRVLIGTDGRVKAAEPVSATSDAFFEATRRQALSKWRFKPATRGGVPQESWKTMSVRFEIANS